MRIQKFMAQCGVASRRKSEELLQKGLVQINGVVVREPGFPVDPEKDSIMVAGKELRCASKIYVMLNKPQGFVSTSKDTHKRRCVLDLVPIKERLYSVGRLDMDTEGLILLTNDGDLTHYLTHPKHEFTKTYQGLVKGCPEEEDLKKFRLGMDIENYHTAPASIKILKRNRETTLLEMKIHEGKKRQIRRMCLAMGYRVLELKRVAIGELTLGDLKVGMWRHLSHKEISYLIGELDHDKNRISKGI